MHHVPQVCAESGCRRFAGRKGASKSDDTHTLSLNMEPGGHYYVRLAMKDSGVWAVRFETPILSPVECGEAVRDGAKMKPLKMSKPDPKHPVDVVATPSVPACEGVDARGGVAEYYRLEKKSPISAAGGSLVPVLTIATVWLAVSDVPAFPVAMGRRLRTEGGLA
jgi:hypothetical protein